MVTHVLADLGADVIKVEHPERGDDLRRWRVKDVEVFWKTYSRNKRSIALDIKRDNDRDILLQLLASADAFVENFVPGTLERLGLAPETLLALNPKLVIVRLSGWGQTGPYRTKPGFGTLVEAMSGFADLNGFADSPPCLPPLATADMIAGLYAAVGLLTALRAVEVNGGQGQVVDISLFEPIFSLISVSAAQYRLTGAPMVRSGNQSTHTAPRNIYACADGRYHRPFRLDAEHGGADHADDRPGRPDRRSALPHQRRPPRQPRRARRDHRRVRGGTGPGRNPGAVRGGRRHRRARSPRSPTSSATLTSRAARSLSRWTIRPDRCPCTTS